MPGMRQGSRIQGRKDPQKDLHDGQACWATELLKWQWNQPQEGTTLSYERVNCWSWVTVPVVWKDGGLEWNIVTINKGGMYWIGVSSISFSLWMFLIHHSSSPDSQPECKGQNIGYLEAVAMEGMEYSWAVFCTGIFPIRFLPKLLM